MEPEVAQYTFRTRPSLQDNFETFDSVNGYVDTNVGNRSWHLLGITSKTQGLVLEISVIAVPMGLATSDNGSMVPYVSDPSQSHYIKAFKLQLEGPKKDDYVCSYFGAWSEYGLDLANPINPVSSPGWLSAPDKDNFWLSHIGININPNV